METIYIVMGVSGVGKTTIGKLLATSLNIPFYDADDFHPQSNKDKMIAGIPLQDKDRWPWLDSLVSQYESWAIHGAVLACSALKKSYRKRLRIDHKNIRLIYLDATYDTVSKRLSERKGHFFNKALLQSQFDTLEKPTEGIITDATKSEKKILATIMNIITSKSQLGLIGLGVMGKSLARNFSRNGVSMSLYNRHIDGKEENIATDFVSSFSELDTSQGFDTIEKFVHSLELPRKIFLMVSAGSPVDTIISELLPFLSEGDVIMDGGNSHYLDTENRIIALKDKGVHFMGVGVSGGEAGALHGPSIMPGGTAYGYTQIAGFLESIAAKDANGYSCCARVGGGGSGHFVKMIHNGIEYAEMQLITEVYDILRNYCGYSLDEIAREFKHWNAGDLNSYLLEITIKILQKKSDDGSPIIDYILDKAGQKGTGSWSTTAALQIGASFDTVAQAVLARILSSQKEERLRAEGVYTLSRKRIENLSISTIKKGYRTARIINHAIGFDSLRIASQHYNWSLDLSEIARIWTNGCIIRSTFMESLVTVYKNNDASALFYPDIVKIMNKNYDSLRVFVSIAIKSGATVPVSSASINYFNGLIQGENASNMIQAQRDFFGAHTYERKDKKGHFHTFWED